MDPNQPQRFPQTKRPSLLSMANFLRINPRTMGVEEEDNNNKQTTNYQEMELASRRSSRQRRRTQRSSTVGITSTQFDKQMILIVATILLTIVPRVVLCASTPPADSGSGGDTATGTRGSPTQQVDRPAKSSLAAPNLDAPELQHQAGLSSEQPRQYFKIHITPGTKQRNSKRAALKEASSAVRRSSSGPGSSQDQAAAAAHHQETGKQKVSNATLKKLLNQSLIKASNGSLASPKASNFKFMFIQRASPQQQHHHKPNKDTSRSKDKDASPPTSGSTNNKSSSGSSASSSGSSSSVSSSPPSSPPLDLVSSTAASLAASVSKALANSLLSSASEIVGNMSSLPSLTSLATQIVVHSLDNNPGKANHGEKHKSSNSTSSAGNSLEQQQNSVVADIKKVSSGAMSSHQGESQAKKKNRPKQPSKIYNLPVKFVANGQPNTIVVFNTIRKHFATIKKLQTERQKFSNGMGEQQVKGNNKQRTKNRNNHNQVHKLKGTNSRFIYLPLKYLSNAKPNKVLIGKTTN